MNSFKKIFILCRKDKENDRYNNLEYQIKNCNVDKNLYQYYEGCWQDEIANMKYDENILVNQKFLNINPAERSLFMNHVNCLKYIKDDYKDGNFLILESDAIFETHFHKDNLKNLMNSVNSFNWDYMSLGRFTIELFSQEGYPKSQAKKLNNLNFYNENRMVCLEAILWNYKGIVKFLDLLKNEFKDKISLPIDCVLDELTQNNKLTTYWVTPSFFYQGSMTKKFKSHLRN